MTPCSILVHRIGARARVLWQAVRRQIQRDVHKSRLAHLTIRNAVFICGSVFLFWSVFGMFGSFNSVSPSGLVVRLRGLRTPVFDRRHDHATLLEHRARVVRNEWTFGPQLTTHLVMRDHRIVGLLEFMEGFSSVKPDVTVITYVFRGKKHIVGLLTDLAKQTMLKRCEIIFVLVPTDDHEERHIIPYMQEHTNVAILRVFNNPGIYSAWNSVIRELARAPYVTCWNIHDRKHPRSLELHHAALDSDDNLHISVSPIVTFRQLELATSEFELIKNHHDSKIRWMKSAGKDIEPEVLFEYDNTGAPIRSRNLNSPMWEASIHSEVGYFDSRWSPWSDWLFWLRCLASGYHAKMLVEPVEAHFEDPERCEQDDVGCHREGNAHLSAVLSTYAGVFKKHVRVLFIHEKVPSRMAGGDRRVLQMLAWLRRRQCTVSLIGRNELFGNYRADLAYLRNMGVAVTVGDEDLNVLNELDLSSFDVIFVGVWFWRLHKPTIVDVVIGQLERIHTMGNRIPELVLVSDDIHYERDKLVGFCSCWQNIREREIRYLSHPYVSLALAICEEDKEAMQKMAPGSNIEVFPFFVEASSLLQMAANGMEVSLSSRNGVLYAGMYHEGNVLSLQWFLMEVWPLVLFHQQSALLYVIGEQWRSVTAASINVIVLNEIPEEELSHKYHSSRLVVAPSLVASSGISTKVFAALQHAVPVVTHSAGTRGICSGHECSEVIAVADTSDKFANHIVTLLDDDDKWMRQRRLASAFAAQHLSEIVLDRVPRSTTELLWRVRGAPTGHHDSGFHDPET